MEKDDMVKKRESVGLGAEFLPGLTADILNYYDCNKRILPWRDSGNPYYIWLSEIMLQQTRVEAVKEYFLRFIEALPTVKDLAECPEDKLLKLWQGLGYYSRARNLKKAANQIMQNWHGRIPEPKRDLLTLAGIGDYSASAIASMAFGQKEVALDGNLIRVFSRLFMLADDFTAQASRKKMTELIMTYMPAQRPGDFNQAVMDIGATICVPKGKPLCERCPVSSGCLSFASGRMQDFPKKKPKKERKIEKKTLFLFYNGKEIFLQRRKEKGVLRGLWEFPWAEGFLNEAEALEFLQDYPEPIFNLKRAGSAKHIFTHLEWHMIAYWVETKMILQDSKGEYPTESKSLSLEQRDEVWADADLIEHHLSLPSAFKKMEEAILHKLRDDDEMYPETLGGNGKRNKQLEDRIERNEPK